MPTTINMVSISRIEKEKVRLKRSRMLITINMVSSKREVD